MKIVLGWWDSQTDFFLLSCERVKRRKAQNNCCGMSEGCRTSDLDLTKVTLQWLSVTLVDFWTSQIWNFIDALNLYENIWRAGYQYSVYQFLLAATQKHYPSRQKKKERKCASSSHLLHPFETQWCLFMMLFIEATMWFVDLMRIFLSHNCRPLFSWKIQKHHISWDIQYDLDPPIPIHSKPCTSQGKNVYGWWITFSLIIFSFDLCCFFFDEKNGARNIQWTNYFPNYALLQWMVIKSSQVSQALSAVRWYTQNNSLNLMFFWKHTKVSEPHCPLISALQLD